MPPTKRSKRTDGPPKNMAYGRHEGAVLLGGTQYPEMEDLERTFWMLNTEESRAAYANRVVKRWVDGLRGDWQILLTALKLVRDHEMYRKAEWVGAASEHPKAYDDFPSYFEDVVKQPFDLFVDMEGTERVLLDAGYRLDQLLGMKYDKAKQLADEVQVLGANQYTLGYSNRIPSPRGGTNSAYTVARLKRDRPDLHARVVAGELSANAAAIEAGFRPKTVTIPLTVEGATRLMLKLSDDERDEVMARVLKAAS
jgi:hypothetical protein